MFAQGLSGYKIIRLLRDKQTQRNERPKTFSAGCKAAFHHKKSPATKTCGRA